MSKVINKYSSGSTGFRGYRYNIKYEYILESSINLMASKFIFRFRPKKVDLLENIWVRPLRTNVFKTKHNYSWRTTKTRHNFLGIGDIL